MRLIRPIRRRKNNLIGYSVLFLLPLLISCGRKHESVTSAIPADSVIQRAQMVVILADIHVLESAIHSVKKKGTTEQDLARFYYDRLFSRYHLSQKRFLSNLNAYQQDPEAFNKLYEDVIRELEKRLDIQKAGNASMRK
jgi:hypothetical protein